MEGEAVARFADGYGGAARAYADVLDPTLDAVAQRIVELAGVTGGERLLDLATGTGAIARKAAQAGARVTGIDIAQPMLEVARERSPAAIDYETADASALPFDDAEFHL